jgi:hypothetical protein
MQNICFAATVVIDVFVAIYLAAVQDTGVPCLMPGCGLVLSCVHYGLWVQHLSVSLTIHNSVKMTYVSNSSLGQRNINSCGGMGQKM